MFVKLGVKDIRVDVIHLEDIIGHSRCCLNIIFISEA